MENTIRQAIIDVLQELGIDGVNFVVEHPTELSHGDYACNVAMAAAKQFGKNPRELAEQIVEKLEEKILDVDKMEVAGPGFINFSLKRNFFKEEIIRASGLGDDWGKNSSLQGKKVLVEYTDPNPFKEFHIGHLFTNSVGESLSRLVEFSGAETKRLCYQGDVGMHVANSIWGMQKLGMTAESAFTARDLGQAYAAGATAYKEDENAQEEIKILNKKIYERSDEEVNKLYDKGREVSLAYFEAVYEVAGTSFDEYFFESEAGPKGKELVLNNPGVFTESNGAYVFDGELHGLHTRVFLNSEGLPTYEAKELALAKMKEDRLGVYDLSIISTANEITEYFKVLKKTMSFVYPELEKKTEHIGHGTVRLTTGKMSSRTGDVVPAIEFIDEIADAVAERMKDSKSDLYKVDELTKDIALGAIKYATLKGNILQDTVFDKEQALSFEGASGPYLQYTHARIHSVLQKAADAGVVQSFENIPQVPYEIEKILYRFEEVINDAVTQRAPHKVATFLIELAGLYNSLYAQEKIADSEDEFAPYKAALSQAVAQTLKNGLWVLGIKAPERM
ncbi:MAG: arginyl-tRNA synthetase [Acidimicrobiales bacterium]|jgi:arginyl-tRNA synthetase